MKQNNLIQEVFPFDNQASSIQKKKLTNQFVYCFNDFNVLNKGKKCNAIGISNKKFLAMEPMKKYNDKKSFVARNSNNSKLQNQTKELQSSLIENKKRYSHTISSERAQTSWEESLSKKMSEFSILHNLEPLPVDALKKIIKREFQTKYRKFPQSISQKNALNYLNEVQQNTNEDEEQLRIGHPIKQRKDKKKITYSVQNNKKNIQEIMEEQRIKKIQLKKKVSQEYAKPFIPPANVTAVSYIVFQPDFSDKKQQNVKVQDKYFLPTIKNMKKNKFPHSHKVITSLNSRSCVEVASLTKIMTCILAIQLCQRYNLEAKQEKICIGKFESNITGTSAKITKGEIYTLEDLLYGLMLPSGNDASLAIAVWGGGKLLNKKQEIKKKSMYFRFIEEMNIKAKCLGMIKTTYLNSHGLANPENKSCAFDIAILSEYAMKNAQFRKIVSCRIYQTTIKYQFDPNKKNMEPINQGVTEDDQMQEGVQKDLQSNQDEEKQDKNFGFKKIEWKNTHHLLQERPKQYIGIKTGITNAAGPCLASCIVEPGGRYFIIVVLNCDQLCMRFKDTEVLKKWVYNREGINASPSKKNKKLKKDEIYQK